MTTQPQEKGRDESAAKSRRAGNYIPERLTPLAFTPFYAKLSDQQRLRYNQLFGLYLIEQTIFFEQVMGQPLLKWFQKFAPARLAADARAFMEEENKHTAWFRQLLRECEPCWYAADGFRLLKAGAIPRALLRFCAARPHLFPCLLWLQILAEERAQGFSGAFIAEAGVLDPRFVEVQRKHLADEGGHIRWDIEFIEWLWPTRSLPIRRFNAWLLGWMLREFFHLPKRSSWNVIERLLLEYPELAARKDDLRAATRSLAQDQTYLRSLYPRCLFPRTRRLADRWPELHFLENFFTD